MMRRVGFWQVHQVLNSRGPSKNNDEPPFYLQFESNQAHTLSTPSPLRPLQIIADHKEDLLNCTPDVRGQLDQLHHTLLVMDG